MYERDKNVECLEDLFIARKKFKEIKMLSA